MFHVIFLVKKSEALTREEFAKYWIEEHTPLTASVPGVTAYRCFVTTGAPEGNAAYDGVAVLAFRDEEAYRRAVDGPEFARAIADAPNFQDTQLTTALFGEEFVIV
ncbi:MAG TPA: EthD family reductase [Thermomicrobiales bacterium]|jgi:uncharacterized protein (TIGR02118 family)|nr:EthD family reductase [Thermomicrobiales bacterium]